MENTRKMVLVPAESIPTTTPMEAKQAPYFVKTDELKNKINKPIDKTKRLFKIALKLALINGYDPDFKLIDINGNLVANSDIELLINHSLSHGKLLIGELEFIQLLHKANIGPELIINENIKEKLRTLNLQQNIKPNNTPNMTITTKSTPEIMETQPFDVITRVPKRVHEDSDEIEVNKKKKSTWEIPESSYPRMIIRKVKKPKTSVKWIEPEEYDKWRDMNDDTDIESVNDEIQDEEPINYDSSKFELKPSKLL